MTASPQLLLPSYGPLPVATKMLPVAASIVAPARPQIPDCVASHELGWSNPVRSLQSEFQTCSSLPLAASRMATWPW